MAISSVCHVFHVFFLLVSSATACDRCLHRSKAAQSSTASALPSAGSCGYGSLAVELNSGQIAAAVPSLYKDGAGCGACFQVRCKDEKLCSKEGTRVIVTDLDRGNSTDFTLSRRAFVAMANTGMSRDILKHTTVDIEYKRVPCEYKNRNLAVRVEESSRKPHYLAIKVLYQGGQTEIVGMDVAQVSKYLPFPNPGSITLSMFQAEPDSVRGLMPNKKTGPFFGVELQVGSPDWKFMSRKYGAVWGTSRVPNGALQFRFVVTAGYDGKWLWARSVLPADWKVGGIYDSGLQITEIAREGCSPCDNGGWR